MAVNISRLCAYPAHKCKDSMFVDQSEYEVAPIIVCQQTIGVSGPKHSCDGSSELEDLMRRRGWKHCPGCKTAFQKESECNHMTCLPPGCVDRAFRACTGNQGSSIRPLSALQLIRGRCNSGR
ncbi:hypothetical protein C8J57DRAFT_1244061 [Mycena rebaudengoi]|nr:hypothetical protein C8J57DRAFT_1244061 [Mycena rebaudengoi]